MNHQLRNLKLRIKPNNRLRKVMEHRINKTTGILDGKILQRIRKNKLIRKRPKKEKIKGK